MYRVTFLKYGEPSESTFPTFAEAHDLARAALRSTAAMGFSHRWTQPPTDRVQIDEVLPGETFFGPYPWIVCYRCNGSAWEPGQGERDGVLCRTCDGEGIVEDRAD